MIGPAISLWLDQLSKSYCLNQLSVRYPRLCTDGLFSGSLPAAINSMVLCHVGNQEALVKASVKQDKRMVFHAFPMTR